MLKFAVRTLLKTPFVTAVAILSLALGIGANVAIFSLFDEILLRPLPVADPGRLVNLTAHGPNPGYGYCSLAGDCEHLLSYPMLTDLERAQTGLTGLAGHFLFDADIDYRNAPLKTQVALVSGSYFPLLGLRPALGRLIAPDDDRAVGANYLAVLSHGYWQRQLGSDSSAIGARLRVNGKTFTIIGVAPPGFEGTTLGAAPSVFVPLTMASAIGVDDPGIFTSRRYYWIAVFGRLAPGTSVETAARRLNTTYSRILSDVEAPLQIGMSAQTMAQFKAKQITLEDGRRGQSMLHAEAKTPLVFLFATTGIVLLIACANIANLLMARGANRSLEMAIRLSLGATRRQLIAQLLTESVLLAAMGGAVSLLIAPWTLDALGALVSPDLASSLQFKMSGVALAFAGGLSAANGLLFGTFPALYYTRSELMTAVREGTGKHSGSRTAARIRNGLATAQIALSMALLAVAGLLVSSLRNVSRVDLGIKTDDVATFGVSPGLNGYGLQRSRDLFSALEQYLGALPGVTGVATAEVPLLGGHERGRGVAVQGFKGGPDVDVSARYSWVGPDFFRVLGIPIVAGRAFSPSDEPGTQQVAIVNETFAKKFGLGRDAVGKYMGDHGGDTTDLLIVGVAKDAKYSKVKGATPPMYFKAERQDRDLVSTYFYVRSPGDPVRLLPAIRGVVAHRDPSLAIEDLKTLPQQVKENVYLDRMIGILSSAFALLATLLAAIGLYGVLAYSVAQRTREIGVRMALGANAGAVQRMVLRQVGAMTLIGGLLGMAGALVFGSGAQSLLYGIKGYDPLVMVVSALALASVALAAGYVPALKASKVDPVQALRYD